MTVATSARDLFENQYRSRTPASKQMHQEALAHMPGGVPGNAAHRDPYPLFVREARGARLVDVDGNSYIDLLIGGGPHILGHSPQVVVDVVRAQVARGTSTIAPPATSIELAAKIKQHMPHIESLRYVTTGSEAMHMAMRTARGFTGRWKIAKFEGNFHGGLDNELVSGRAVDGSRQHPLPIADSAGIPAGIVADTVVMPYNDAELAAEILEAGASDIAAVVVEPIAGTWMGGVAADQSFLTAIRKITERLGILLIFDEVVTGFRVGLGGAAALYGVRPDLTALAKIIGGGFPLGAFGGRRDVMETLAPARTPAEAQQRVFHSGTFQSNLVAMAAGLAVLRELEAPGVLERINGLGDRLRSGLRERAEAAGLAMTFGGYGAIVSMHFGDRPMRDMRDVLASDRVAAGIFGLGLVANGVYLTPYHVGLTNGAQTDADIDAVLDTAAYVMKEMRGP